MVVWRGTHDHQCQDEDDRPDHSGDIKIVHRHIGTPNEASHASLKPLHFSARVYQGRKGKRREYLGINDAVL